MTDPELASARRPGNWAKLTALCGALTILYVAALALLRGGTFGDLLRAIAAVAFGPPALQWGAGGAVAGLLSHFAAVAAAVAAGLALLSRPPLRALAAWKAGTLYGLALYFLFHGLVLPMRFGLPFPESDRGKLALELLAYIALIGFPVTLAAQGRWLSRAPRRF